MFFNIHCNIKSLGSEFDSNSNLNNIDLEATYPFIKMKRTPCFGKCPYYEFVIFSNGDVLYEGFNFVERIGKFKGEINIKKIAFIKEKLKEVEFFKFDSVYDAGVSDLPSTIYLEKFYRSKNNSISCPIFSISLELSPRKLITETRFILDSAISILWERKLLKTSMPSFVICCLI